MEKVAHAGHDGDGQALRPGPVEHGGEGHHVVDLTVDDHGVGRHGGGVEAAGRRADEDEALGRFGQRQGGPRGDLYVDVHVRPHPLFERQDSHLLCRVPIGFAQAALGTSVDVPRLDGSTQTVEIPAGTQPGEVIRLRGEGLPDPRGGRAGDLHVEIQVEVPKTLDAEQEKLLRQLAEHEKKNVTPERKGFFETIKDLFTGEE